MSILEGGMATLEGVWLHWRRYVYTGGAMSVLERVCLC